MKNKIIPIRIYMLHSMALAVVLACSPGVFSALVLSPLLPKKLGCYTCFQQVDHSSNMTMRANKVAFREKTPEL